jgi:1,2-diacylglycerol 3-beta-galactosyltransferase
MDRLNPSKPHVVFLFSDTGGGHRSAADAIIEALQLEFGDTFTTEMLDIFESAPRPLNHLPKLYPPMARMPDAWELGYHLSNGAQRTRLLLRIIWPYIRRSAKRLLKEHPCDMIVSVHPLATTAYIRAMGPGGPPFVIVVTDMVSVHAFWYNRHADLILVATEEARQRGITNGVSPDRIRVVGMPIADRFCSVSGDKSSLRQKFGLPLDKPVILLVGGGEGMGPIAKNALAIDKAGLDVALVVVTGRNRKLKANLETHPWQIPARIFGFVTEMPELMHAADVLLTKAGPGTICEAFIAGLPIIIYSHMPGQEDGNIKYVVSEGAGVWAPDPDDVVSVLTHWVNNPEEMERVKALSASLAKPDSSRKIARILAGVLGV